MLDDAQQMKRVGVPWVDREDPRVYGLGGGQITPLMQSQSLLEQTVLIHSGKVTYTSRTIWER